MTTLIPKDVVESTYEHISLNKKLEALEIALTNYKKQIERFDGESATGLCMVFDSASRRAIGNPVIFSSGFKQFKELNNWLYNRMFYYKKSQPEPNTFFTRSGEETPCHIASFFWPYRDTASRIQFLKTMIEETKDKISKQ